MKPPLIGVTTYRLPGTAGIPMYAIAQAYIHALASAGAAPVQIPLGLSEDRLDTILRRLDGILFTGGGDIHPRRFDTDLDEHVNQIDEDRDRVELYLLNAIMDKQRPFLGICRGFQLVNVGLGGTLLTDIQAHLPGSLKHDYYPDWPRDHLAHPVEIAPGSRLHTILGTQATQVNSLHHQGVDRLAPGLVPTASAPDGLPEAFELPGYPFGLAVQWHPEWLQAYQPMQALFWAFVAACAAD